ncbi:MAG TPA: hypothetical protein VFR86_23305, partial [Burkholderiaceae bacterium]|nr:hypothetical protein [Burkholderiaceae bacterium]
MYAETRERAAFYLAAKRSGPEHSVAEVLGLRPALFAAYRDLTALRYDFPVVLLKEAPAGSGDGARVEPLSALIDRAVEATGLSGNDGERLRAHALQWEREVRALAARGRTGTLAALLEEAARSLGAEGEAASDDLRRLQKELPGDAEVADCNAALPARMVAHLWQAAQKRKAAGFRARVERLIVKLNDILRADFARSTAGCTPARLRSGVGAAFEQAFDFDRLSGLLQRVATDSSRGEARRQRIEAILDVLTAQRFYAVAGSKAEPFRLQLDSGARAVAAFKMRLPAMADLLRAMTASELELEGVLSEDANGVRQEALLRQLGDHSVDGRELALFPDYLVCLNARDLDAAEYDALMELFAGGVPAKVLVQIDDLLPEGQDPGGPLAFGARYRQLANTAMGMHDVFVVQTPSSNLVRYRDRIAKALSDPRPALLLVYSGASEAAGAKSARAAHLAGQDAARAAEGLPPYLVAAAALESRAFPAFCYDPSAGADWVARLSVDGNPQPERDWPLHQLTYEDAAHQRVAQDVAFTFVDFVACDRRYAGHFAPMGPEPAGANAAGAQDSLAPVTACLDRETRLLPDRFPSLWMVDGDNVLQRVLVDQTLIHAARRCRDVWQRLQEQAGLRGPYAEQLRARAQAP